MEVSSYIAGILLEYNLTSNVPLNMKKIAVWNIQINSNKKQMFNQIQEHRNWRDEYSCRISSEFRNSAIDIC